MPHFLGASLDASRWFVGLCCRLPHSHASAGSRGVVFTACVTPSALCDPTRAALRLRCDDQPCGVLDNNRNLALDRPNNYRNLSDAGCSVGGCSIWQRGWTIAGRRTGVAAGMGFTDGCDSEGKWDGVGKKWRVPITGICARFFDALGLREMYVADMAERWSAVGPISSLVSAVGYQYLWRRLV